jgi:plasmid stabilization system protein ParE
VRRYLVRRAASVTRDLAAIRQHLISSYEEFGDTRQAATGRATVRLREAFDYMQTFASHPHRGTVHPELQAGIRHVTHRNFVFYFEIEEQGAEVKILAVFFGGSDHLRQIVGRFAKR